MTSTETLLSELRRSHPELNPQLICKSETAEVDNEKAPDQLVALTVNGMSIVDLFNSTCGRFAVAPQKAYGIPLMTALRVHEHNGIDLGTVEPKMLSADHFAGLPADVKVAIARLGANRSRLADTAAQCDPHGDFKTYSDTQMVEMAEAHGVMGGTLFAADEDRQGLLNRIMIERLFNPVAGSDVEPDDIEAYLSETDEPSVNGFKAWLAGISLAR